MRIENSQGIENKRKSYMKKCEAENCYRPYLAKGYCRKHYQQIYKHGRLMPEREKEYGHTICKVEECNKPHKAKGYCAKHLFHYSKGTLGQRTIYDPNEITIDGSKAYIQLYDRDCQAVAQTVIDTEDIYRVVSYKWHLSGSGYVKTDMKQNGERVSLFLHKLINNTPDGLDTNHISDDLLDNRKSNFRTATHI
jgi:hypothetical protein